MNIIVCLQWIAITAGVVHTKLFDTCDLSIESKAHRALEASTKRIVEQISLSGATGAAEQESESDLYFQPEENKYLAQCSALSSAFTNPHFRIIEKRKKIFFQVDVPSSAQDGPIPSKSTAPVSVLPSKGSLAVLPAMARAENKPSSSFSSSSSSFSIDLQPVSKPSRSFLGIMPSQKKTIERLSVDKVVLSSYYSY